MASEWQLLVSPFYLAAAGAVAAILILCLRARRALTSRDLALRSADVPLRANGRGGWRYSEILEYTHDAIIIWEMDGAGVVYWNRAAEELYGYSRREAVGQKTHLLLKTQLDEGVRRLETKLATYGVWAGELLHTAKCGRQIAVQSRLALMHQQSGRWLVLEVNRALSGEPRPSPRVAVESHLQALRSNRPV
jgi:PAS domain S-box-containing protein